MSAGDRQKTLRDYLREGPFALAMSSGFFAFFAHTGFLTVLEDEGLLPTRVSGSSAGALVAGAWAGGLDGPVLAAELQKLQRRDFWDPGLGAGLLRGQLFRDGLERMLPAPVFDRCRVPTAISVFEARSRTTRVLTSGSLSTAIQASCAVPLLFHPVEIDGRAHFDGGILDRPGLAGMPETEPRVLFHHIASKSAWRSKLELPRRPGMVTVVLEGLPRSGPFRLEEGRLAFTAAREATKRALGQPIEDDLVSVQVAVRSHFAVASSAG
jgi:NTE family protein